MSRQFTNPIFPRNNLQQAIASVSPPAPDVGVLDAWYREHWPDLFSPFPAPSPGFAASVVSTNRGQTTPRAGPYQQIHFTEPSTVGNEFQAAPSTPRGRLAELAQPRTGYGSPAPTGPRLMDVEKELELIMPEEVRNLWRPWMRDQYNAFAALLIALQRAAREGGASARDLAIRLRLDLTEPGGIAYHVAAHLQLPVGGPGAHPQDIIALFTEAGIPVETLEENSADLQTLSRNHPYMKRVYDKARSYMQILTLHRPSALLGLTSGSARVRAEARGYPVTRADLEERTNGTGIPRLWTAQANAGRTQALVNTFLLLGWWEGGRTETAEELQELIVNILMASSRVIRFSSFAQEPITPADASRILRDGGTFRHVMERREDRGFPGVGWRSLPEILHIMLRDHLNNIYRFVSVGLNNNRAFQNSVGQPFNPDGSIALWSGR